MMFLCNLGCICSMPRKLIPSLLLAVFLWVQVGMVVHGAEYGFGEHKHNGKVCELGEFTQHNPTPVLPAPAAIAMPVPVVVSYTLPERYTISSQVSFRANAPRAPPLLG